MQVYSLVERAFPARQCLDLHDVGGSMKPQSEYLGAAMKVEDRRAEASTMRRDAAI
ncbi:hypothetical protein [Devosia elaeis]|uniref:hypothetical protein n=1 Tax=Devosia elaeis TaxID=1770058 RepID=UPI0013F4D7FB|nr:hypothetical protein [Devosia elaeis]